MKAIVTEEFTTPEGDLLAVGDIVSGRHARLAFEAGKADHLTGKQAAKIEGQILNERGYVLNAETGRLRAIKKG